MKRVNQSKLASELRRYLSAKRQEEPPDREFSEPESTNKPEKNEESNDSQQSDQHSNGTPEEQLISLGKQAEGCTKCGLSENRKQVVFGEGSAHARVFVIGEAPGAQEDEKGRPFIGKAGELLRQGFKKVQLNINQVYITNTVKCRPPDNRDPKTDELDSCQPYLDRQLELVDPEVVLALGAFAINYCREGDHGVGSSRGTVHRWNHRKLVATYHPAYILRNNNQAQAFIDDLKKVKNLISA